MCGNRVGIDIGGTFTDLAVVNEETGQIANIKVPSTPSSPAQGVISAFRMFLQTTKPQDVTTVTHATTIAVNALLGQVGLELPTAALITTAGLRDVLEIGRQRRHELYNLFVERPRALVPRRYRYEVEERVGYDGRVIKKLSPRSLKRVVTRLKRNGVDAVAIGLLHSHKNPYHESEIKKAVEKDCHGVFVSASHEVAPEYREYERISTTVVNSVLMPIISAYLDQVSSKIAELGVPSPLCVMQSSGGIASKEIVQGRPVSIIESGPAAGVIASACYGKSFGLQNILTFDMGGTTAKAGAIRNGVPEIVTEYEVAGRVHAGRIVKGSGYPVRFPFIDVVETSAGGGTIAWLDEAGALRMGPLSAGADPGPACYGKAADPTVTDANLILGRLNPEYLLAGKMRLFPEASKKAIEEKICRKSGLELTEAAAGIVRIINSNMAKILRMVSVERGYDPRQFSLISFGGAGPMHACVLAQELCIPRILVPSNPGLFSALGLLTADFRHDGVRALMKAIDSVSAEEVEAAFENLRSEGRRFLECQGVQSESMVFSRQIEMRYIGQSYELTVPAADRLTSQELSLAKESFHSKHESIYGYSVPTEPVELVNIRLASIGLVPRPRPSEQRFVGKEPSDDAILSMRRVFFEKYEGFVECPIYLRERLAPGNSLSGPAVVEQYDATTIVYPDWNACIDKIGSIQMTFMG
mgnify:CR=1 FL=1